MHDEDDRLAPFPIEHFVRIRTRFALHDWCRAECARTRPPGWLIVAQIACVIGGLFWWPLLLAPVLCFPWVWFRMGRWEALLAVRKHLNDRNAQDLSEVDAGIGITKAFPQG